MEMNLDSIEVSKACMKHKQLVDARQSVKPSENGIVGYLPNVNIVGKPTMKWKFERGEFVLNK